MLRLLALRTSVILSSLILLILSRASASDPQRLIDSRASGASQGDFVVAIWVLHSKQNTRDWSLGLSRDGWSILFLADNHDELDDAAAANFKVSIRLPSKPGYPPRVLHTNTTLASNEWHHVVFSYSSELHLASLCVDTACSTSISLGRDVARLRSGTLETAICSSACSWSFAGGVRGESNGEAGARAGAAAGGGFDTMQPDLSPCDGARGVGLDRCAELLRMDGVSSGNQLGSEAVPSAEVRSSTISGGQKQYHQQSAGFRSSSSSGGNRDSCGSSGDQKHCASSVWIHDVSIWNGPMPGLSLPLLHAVSCPSTLALSQASTSLAAPLSAIVQPVGLKQAWLWSSSQQPASTQPMLAAPCGVANQAAFTPPLVDASTTSTTSAATGRQVDTDATTTISTSKAASTPPLVDASTTNSSKPAPISSQLDAAATTSTSTTTWAQLDAAATTSTSTTTQAQLDTSASTSTSTTTQAQLDTASTTSTPTTTRAQVDTTAPTSTSTSTTTRAQVDRAAATTSTSTSTQEVGAATTATTTTSKERVHSHASGEHGTQTLTASESSDALGFGFGLFGPSRRLLKDGCQSTGTVVALAVMLNLFAIAAIGLGFLTYQQRYKLKELSHTLDMVMGEPSTLFIPVGGKDHQHASVTQFDSGSVLTRRDKSDGAASGVLVLRKPDGSMIYQSVTSPQEPSAETRRGTPAAAEIAPAQMSRLSNVAFAQQQQQGQPGSSAVLAVPHRAASQAVFHDEHPYSVVAGPAYSHLKVASRSKSESTQIGTAAALNERVGNSRNNLLASWFPKRLQAVFSKGSPTNSPSGSNMSLNSIALRVHQPAATNPLFESALNPSLGETGGHALFEVSTIHTHNSGSLGSSQPLPFIAGSSPLLPGYNSHSPPLPPEGAAPNREDASGSWPNKEHGGPRSGVSWDPNVAASPFGLATALTTITETSDSVTTQGPHSGRMGGLSALSMPSVHTPRREGTPGGSRMSPRNPQVVADDYTADTAGLLNVGVEHPPQIPQHSRMKPPRNNSDNSKDGADGERSSSHSKLGRSLTPQDSLSSSRYDTSYSQCSGFSRHYSPTSGAISAISRHHSRSPSEAANTRPPGPGAGPAGEIEPRGVSWAQSPNSSTPALEQTSQKAASGDNSWTDDRRITKMGSRGWAGVSFTALAGHGPEAAPWSEGPVPGGPEVSVGGIGRPPTSSAHPLNSRAVQQQLQRLAEERSKARSDASSEISYPSSRSTSRLPSRLSASAAAAAERTFNQPSQRVSNSNISTHPNDFILTSPTPIGGHTPEGSTKLSRLSATPSHYHNVLAAQHTLSEDQAAGHRTSVERPNRLARTVSEADAKAARLPARVGFAQATTSVDISEFLAPQEAAAVAAAAASEFIRERGSHGSGPHQRPASAGIGPATRGSGGSSSTAQGPPPSQFPTPNTRPNSRGPHTPSGGGAHRTMSESPSPHYNALHSPQQSHYIASPSPQGASLPPRSLSRMPSGRFPSNEGIRHSASSHAYPHTSPRNPATTSMGAIAYNRKRGSDAGSEIDYYNNLSTPKSSFNVFNPQSGSRGGHSGYRPQSPEPSLIETANSTPYHRNSQPDLYHHHQLLHQDGPGRSSAGAFPYAVNEMWERDRRREYMKPQSRSQFKQSMKRSQSSFIDDNYHPDDSPHHIDDGYYHRDGQPSSRAYYPDDLHCDNNMQHDRHWRGSQPSRALSMSGTAHDPMYGSAGPPRRLRDEDMDPRNERYQGSGVPPATAARLGFFSRRFTYSGAAGDREQGSPSGWEDGGSRSFSRVQSFGPGQPGRHLGGIGTTSRRSHDSVHSAIVVVTDSDPMLPDVCLEMVLHDDVEIDESEPLGEGAYGTVYRGVYRNMDVAVKFAQKSIVDGLVQEKALETLQQESKILSRVRHPNIVRFYGGSMVPPTVFIVEELMHQDLSNLVHSSGVTLPLDEVIRIGKDICMGLFHLHPTIIHRDLKPANVLMDRFNNAKITDFGMARFKLTTHLSTKTPDAGTVAYMAPECFQESTLTPKADVYSWAIIMFEMLTGEMPWYGSNNMGIIYNVVMKGLRPELPEEEERCPTDLKALIQDCWHQDAKSRPSTGEIVKMLTLILKVRERAATTKKAEGEE